LKLGQLLIEPLNAFLHTSQRMAANLVAIWHRLPPKKLKYQRTEEDTEGRIQKNEPLAVQLFVVTLFHQPAKAFKLRIRTKPFWLTNRPVTSTFSRVVLGCYPFKSVEQCRGVRVGVTFDIKRTCSTIDIVSERRQFAIHSKFSDGLPPPSAWAEGAPASSVAASPPSSDEINTRILLQSAAVDFVFLCDGRSEAVHQIKPHQVVYCYLQNLKERYLVGREARHEQSRREKADRFTRVDEKDHR
jgi:hypothetical protein